MKVKLGLRDKPEHGIAHGFWQRTYSKGPDATMEETVLTNQHKQMQLQKSASASSAADGHARIGSRVLFNAS